MSGQANLRSEFMALVAAYEDDDEVAIQRIGERLRASGNSFRLVLEEDTTWEESMVEGYAEFPVVTQLFKVLLGDVLVYEGARQFGSSLEDSTHTGLGGGWVTIRVDDEEHGAAEMALEDFGVEIEWPTAPPAR